MVGPGGDSATIPMFRATSPRSRTPLQSRTQEKKGKIEKEALWLRGQRLLRTRAECVFSDGQRPGSTDVCGRHGDAGRLLARLLASRLPQCGYGLALRSVQENASAEGNLRGFFDWERKVTGRYFPVGSHVLIAAAGVAQAIRLRVLSAIPHSSKQATRFSIGSGSRAAFRCAHPTRARPAHLCTVASLLAGEHTAISGLVSAGWSFCARLRNARWRVRRCCCHFSCDPAIHATIFSRVVSRISSGGSWDRAEKG